MRRPCHTWISSSSKYIAPDVFTSPDCFDYAGKSSVMRELPQMACGTCRSFLPERSTPPTGRITAVRQQNMFKICLILDQDKYELNLINVEFFKIWFN